MEKHICFGCMEELANAGVCPKCGFDNANSVIDPHHLIPGTARNNLPLCYRSCPR